MPDLMGLGSSGGGYAIGDIRYSVRGSGINLLPAPRSVWTLYLDYIPISTLLTDPAHTFDGINGWEEWAVLTAAIRCAIKDEQDHSALMAERQVLDERIAKLAGQRDGGAPARIQDTRQDDDYATLAGLRNDWDW